MRHQIIIMNLFSFFFTQTLTSKFHVPIKGLWFHYIIISTDLYSKNSCTHLKIMTSLYYFEFIVKLVIWFHREFEICEVNIWFGDCSWGRPEDSLFNSYYTTFPGLFHFTFDMYLILPSVNKEASSTIFKVFGMTRPGIEPSSSKPLANTLHTRPMSRLVSKIQITNLENGVILDIIQNNNNTPLVFGGGNQSTLILALLVDWNF